MNRLNRDYSHAVRPFGAADSKLLHLSKVNREQTKDIALFRRSLSGFILINCLDGFGLQLQAQIATSTLPFESRESSRQEASSAWRSISKTEKKCGPATQNRQLMITKHDPHIIINWLHFESVQKNLNCFNSGYDKLSLISTSTRISNYPKQT